MRALSASRLLLLLSAPLSAALPSTAGAAAGDTACVDCHVDSAVELAASAHGGLDPQVGCVECHAPHLPGQGQPDEKLEALAPLLDGNDLDTCGGCHPAELEVYRDTYHGRYQAMGKGNVPTCTWCHAGHEVSLTNAASPLRPERLGAVCAGCHGGDTKDARASFAAGLSKGATGDTLYRRDTAARVGADLLGGLWMAGVLALLVLMGLRGVRMLRGRAGNPPATAPWPLRLQAVLFFAFFIILDNSGLALLYATPGGDMLHATMHDAIAPIRALYSDADARSVLHRLAGLGLLTVSLWHVLWLALGGARRAKLWPAPRLVSRLWAELRSRPSSARGTDPLSSAVWLMVIASVAAMLVTGLAQWLLLPALDDVGFAGWQLTERIHEQVGRALSILCWGGLLGWFGLAQPLLRRAHRALASVAVLMLLVLPALSGCDSQTSSTVEPPTVSGVANGAFVSAKTCGRCHEREYKEWEDSYHARSLSPTYAAMFTIFEYNTGGGQEAYCFNCHAPSTKLVDRVDELTRQVQAGEAPDDEGVTCIYCHAMTAVDDSYDYRVPATWEPGQSPPFHDVYRTTLTASSDLCSACHDYNNPNMVHPEQASTPCCTLNRTWKKTSYARNGVTCQTCHMRNVLDDPTSPTQDAAYSVAGLGRWRDDRGRVSHRFPGGRDEELLKKATTLTLQAHRDGAEVVAVVDIKSHAGHPIPDG